MSTKTTLGILVVTAAIVAAAGLLMLPSVTNTAYAQAASGGTGSGGTGAGGAASGGASGGGGGGASGGAASGSGGSGAGGSGGAASFSVFKEEKEIVPFIGQLG